MHNSFALGISVGESFAEYSILSQSPTAAAQSVAQRRVYLSRESLKNSLGKFLAEHSDTKPEQVFISLRLPKKLLDFNYSGAVAHITTAGFEHWLSLCDERRADLTESSLLFSVPERILADGRIEKALRLEDLEAISVQLEAAACKKVCLHFLHSTKNPVHLHQAQTYFTEKNYEVFIPQEDSDGSSLGEVSRWTENALNATTSTVFHQIKSDLLKTLENTLGSEHIYFLNSEGEALPAAEPLLPMRSCFAAFTAVGKVFGFAKKADVLYLGFESFLLISESQAAAEWKSPWGAVQVPHLSSQELGIQPTLGIHLNSFGHFDFSPSQSGWEPGPMFFGRGQKTTLLDLWSENPKLLKLSGLEDKIVLAGVQRFKNTLFALSKNSLPRNRDLPQVTKDLQSLCLQRLAMESFLRRRQENLVVTGPLASVFGNAFKKDAKSFVDSQEMSEAHATAVWGLKGLKGSL